MVYNNITVDKISSNGLLLKQVGSVHTYDKLMKIIINIPHEDYVEQQQFIEKCIKDLELFRNDTKNRFDMSNTLFEFNAILDVIKEINMLTVKAEIPRGRREIIPTMGLSYVKIFFGFITSAFSPGSDNKEKKISMLTDRTQSLSNYSIETIDSIQVKNKNTDDKIDKITKKLNELIAKQTENNDNDVFELKINQLIQSLTLTILRYKNHQEKIFKYIKKNKTSNIDPDIVSYIRLHKIIEDIKNQSEKNLFWNIIDDSDFIKWYQIAPMKIAVTNGDVIIEIDIPLISIDRRNIYETLAVPAISKNSLTIIHPDSPYIITNIQKTEMAHLTENDFKNCLRESKEVYICPQTFPVYTDGKFCELSILSNNVSMSNKCTITTVPLRNVILKLKVINQYYFAFIRSEIFNVNCNHNVTQIVLNGTGIMSISEGCYIYNDNINIAAQSVLRMKTKHKFISSNFSLLNQEKSQAIQKLIFDEKELIIMDTNFENIKAKINEEQKEFRTRIEQFEDNHKISTEYTFITMIVALAIIYLIKRTCCK